MYIIIMSQKGAIKSAIKSNVLSQYLSYILSYKPYIFIYCTAGYLTLPACPTHCSCLLPFVHNFFSRQIDFQLFAWQFAAQLVAACCYCASSRITTVSGCSFPLSCTPNPSSQHTAFPIFTLTSSVKSPKCLTSCVS